MTIEISCNLSDGVIMGADSAITISGKVGLPGDVREGVLKVYNEAEKIFQLCNLPVGIMTYGIGMLGERTLESYIREFEYSDKYKEKQKQSITTYTEDNPPTMTIKEIAEDLKEFFIEKYEEFFKVPLEQKFGQKYEEIPPQNKPLLGLVIGGYAPGEYLSEVWQIQIPHDDKVRQVREKGNFGSNWFGMNQAIIRLIKGFELALLCTLIKSYDC